MQYSKFILMLGLLFGLTACGPKELSFEESTEDVDLSAFHKAMSGTLDSAITFEMSGKANFDDGESSISFGYTIRMMRDSVIWMDITDPFVGMKVARALIYPDSAVMYNRFESTWMAGGTEVIQRAFQVHLNFNHLQSVLLGEPIYIPLEEDDLSIDRLPGQIHAMVAGLPGDELFRYTTPAYRYQYGYTEGLPLIQQSFADSLDKATIDYIYSETDTGLPIEVTLNVTKDRTFNITFEHNDVRRDVDLHIPFSIPSGYERLQ